MASPLVDLATADNQRYKDSLTANGPALGDAKTAFDDQQGAVATATTKLGADLSALAPLRDALAASPMPADAIALADEFEALIAKTRADQAALIAAQKAEDEDGAQLAYLIDAVNRDTQKVAATQATLDAANAAETKRDAWDAALGQPPLNTVRTDAQNAIDGPGADAETRLHNDIPAELFDLAAARYARETARQQRVQAASELASVLLAVRTVDDGGVAAAAAQAEADYTAAFNAFADYVGQAPERLARSSAALAAITAAPELSADELARMTDPAIHDPGVTAAGVIGPVETAIDGIAVAQQDYDDAVLTAREADPEVDLTTVPPVGTAKDALKAAATALETALTGLTQPPLTADEKNALDAWGGPAVPDDIDDLETMIATMLTAAAAGTADQRKALAAWEATVPDSAWDAFVSYQDATADLTDLAAEDPAVSVSGTLDTAETGLATALADAQESERAQWLLTEEAKRRAALEAAELAGGRTRLVSATRGDG